MMNNTLSRLHDQGYGEYVSEYSELLGGGLWGIVIDQVQILIFENGLRHKCESVIEINYRDVVGIKSSLTIDKISKSQREEIKTLIMRFECGSDVHDLEIPFAIYSILLGYFCDQVKQSQGKEVVTGFISV